MTFKSAIEFHVKFTVKMMTYCKNPDGSLQEDVVSRADVCALGKWIAAEKANHEQDPQFHELEKAHNEFHKAAAGVVRKVNAGGDGRPDVAFGSPSVYGRASVELTDLLSAVAEKYG